MPEPIDIITFDCYGTLIDWETGIITAFQSEAARDGVELQPDQIIEAYSTQEPQVEKPPYRSYRDVLAETAVRAANTLGWKIDVTRAGFLAASLPHWKPFSDTNPALERLARHYKLGILSNIDDDLLTTTRKHFLTPFDLVITAQQVKSYKPGLAHFNEAIVRAGGRNLWHAAQSYFHDVVPATSLGIPVVWVNRKGQSVEPGGPKPTYEVSNLNDLASFLGV